MSLVAQREKKIFTRTCWGEFFCANLKQLLSFSPLYMLRRKEKKNEKKQYNFHELALQY